MPIDDLYCYLIDDESVYLTDDNDDLLVGSCYGVATEAVPAGKERIFIEDLSGNTINDVEAQDATDYATNLRFSSQWPKGYATCTFRIRRRDILAGFSIKESYGVVIYDGAEIVWQGRLEDIKKTISGGDEYIECMAVGWYVVLEERLIRKRWLDNNVLNHLYVPSDRLTSSEQLEWDATRRDNFWLVRAGMRDVDKNDEEYYEEHYTMYANIKNVATSYQYRTGEAFNVRVYDIDNSAQEYSSGDQVSAGGTSSSFDVDMTNNTEIIGLRIVAAVAPSDTFDQNDWVEMYDTTAQARYHDSHSAHDSEAYTNGEMVEDVLLLVNDVASTLSTDYDDIADPGQTVNTFTIEEFTPAGQVIEQLAEYSDASYNTYGLSVWSRQRTTDNKPKVEFNAWDIDDYEIIINLEGDELSSFQNSADGSNLYNYIRVQYVDSQGRTAIRTPDDNANLKDDTSITNEYRREKLIKIGKANSTDADNIGRRYLTRYKNRVYKGSVTVKGFVTKKDGARIPGNRVQAGWRFFVPQLEQIFFIRYANYNAENKTLTITPDLPPDNTAFIIAELRRKAETSEAKYTGFG